MQGISFILESFFDRAPIDTDELAENFNVIFQQFH
jgi:hypothetical protein